MKNSIFENNLLNLYRLYLDSVHWKSSGVWPPFGTRSFWIVRTRIKLQNKIERQNKWLWKRSFRTLLLFGRVDDQGFYVYVLDCHMLDQLPLRILQNHYLPNVLTLFIIKWIRDTKYTWLRVHRELFPVLVVGQEDR